MTLTMAGAPLAARPPEDVNYRLDGPAHKLFFDDFPRRVRAMFGGELVADTVRGRMLHESGLLPVLYLPDDDVVAKYLERTDHTTHCPFKGDAAYWSMRVGDRVAENAVWAYPEPNEAAAWLDGYLAIYWAGMDSWYDEDEEVAGHLRDPYHRVDVRETGRRVRVLTPDSNGEVVADTTRAKLLSETGLPNRFYIPRDDVRVELLTPSPTRTVCPYKGTATYFSLRIGDRVLDDAAFSYTVPLENAQKAADHLCFVHDEIANEVAAAEYT